ncbi:IclR family transcriptional regulator [Roseicyclus sp.]|uniref:IclR family transcriptional regulator n=1 Tax=Roseicyclus sp. TaxID=1914329 RepID=UPI003F6CD941
MSSTSGSGERILAILDLFTLDRREWSPDAMMAALGYSRPTLYRYLKTLKSAGYLASAPGDGLTLGPRVTELDFLMQRSDPLIAAAAPFIKILAARYPGVALITRWYGSKILCVASERSPDAPISSYPRGQPMPIARGGISRVIMANLPRREQDRLIETQREMLAGPNTTAAALRETYRAVRRMGYCTAWGEVTPGVVGVAGPILAAERMPIGAISITSNSATMQADRLAAIERDVRDSAAAISGMFCARSIQPMVDAPAPAHALTDQDIHQRVPSPRRHRQ